MDYEKDAPLTTLARYVVNPSAVAFTKRLLSYTHTNLRDKQPERHSNLRIRFFNRIWTMRRTSR